MKRTLFYSLFLLVAELILSVDENIAFFLDHIITT